jgi:hypothetical protein
VVKTNNAVGYSLKTIDPFVCTPQCPKFPG